MRTSAWGKSRREPLLIDLGPQGGGAHGAFTWGVLDRLLEEPWLRIDGISRTSAGAMNAAVLVHGFVQNGAPGARAALEEFWRKVSRAALLSPFQRTPLDVLLGRWTLDNSPMFLAADMMAASVLPLRSEPDRGEPAALYSRRICRFRAPVGWVHQAFRHGHERQDWPRSRIAKR